MITLPKMETPEFGVHDMMAFGVGAWVGRILIRAVWFKILLCCRLLV
jgi:hypothetical protein